MRYDVILFDADGTLLDFQRSEAEAISAVLNRFGLPNTPEVRKYYRTLNEQLWHDFETEKFSKQHIFDVRFPTLLNYCGIVGDGKAMEAYYRDQLNHGAHLMDHALPMCEALAKRLDLYIVTNGVAQTQELRLAQSGLRGYFQAVFTSEAIGYRKPQIEFFAAVLDQIPHSKERMLLVGDSLHSDILGANRSGIDACWFHPASAVGDAGIVARYEITSLEELWNIL